MSHSWEEGKIKANSLEEIEFTLHGEPNEDGEEIRHLFSQDGSNPLPVNSILSQVASLYDRVAKEPVGRVLNKDEAVLIHAYEKDGIIAVEDHELGKLTVRIESEKVPELEEKIEKRSEIHPENLESEESTEKRREL